MQWYKQTRLLKLDFKDGRSPATWGDSSRWLL